LKLFQYAEEASSGKIFFVKNGNFGNTKINATKAENWTKLEILFKKVSNWQ